MKQIACLLSVVSIACSCLVLGSSLNSSLSKKIIGGEDAPNNTFPFIVALKIIHPETKKETFFCGGSIIHKHWIVTAGHCLVMKDFVVLAGTTLWQTDDPKLIYEVEKTVRHPFYKNVTEDNDIGLVKLRSDLDFANPNIAPIALGNIGNNEKVVSLGWGFQYPAYDAPILNQLKMIELETDYVCNPNATKSRRAFYNRFRICTKGGTTFGTCNGDSGSPLINPANYELVGLVSGGLGECASGAADIFTRLWAYKPWIDLNLMMS